MSKLSAKQRRELAYKIYQTFPDNNVRHQYRFKDDQHLVDQVLYFFYHGSEMIYPAKYIFCNIVYSYYLQQYFGIDFYDSLDDRQTLFDSDYPIIYSDKPQVYDYIIKQIYQDIPTLQSVKKTRLFFKMEYLIADEDLSEVHPLANLYGIPL